MSADRFLYLIMMAILAVSLSLINPQFAEAAVGCIKVTDHVEFDNGDGEWDAPCTEDSSNYPCYWIPTPLCEECLEKFCYTATEFECYIDVLVYVDSKPAYNCQTWVTLNKRCRNNTGDGSVFYCGNNGHPTCNFTCGSQSTSSLLNNWKSGSWISDSRDVLCDC